MYHQLTQLFKKRRLNVSFSLSFIICSCFLLFHNCGGGVKKRNKFRQTAKLSLPAKGKSMMPKMVYVDGGSFAIGGSNGAESKIITLNAFLISQYLIDNRHYLMYLSDLKNSKRLKEYKAALPSKDVWDAEFKFNDHLKDYYCARKFLDYPVVGVSFHQASRYCEWLTEKELGTHAKSSKKGSVDGKNSAKPATENKSGSNSAPVTDHSVEVASDQKTTTENVSQEKEKNQNVDENNASKRSEVEDNKSVKNVSLADDNAVSDEEMAMIEDSYNYLQNLAKSDPVYKYRLPTESELQYAAKGSIISQDKDGVESTMIVDYGNIKSSVRHSEGKEQGDFVGLFNVSRGDYKGIPGERETDAPTEYVDSRAPNGVGVVGCYGNVWEWTVDIFRLKPSYDYADYNPCRVDEAYDNTYDAASPLHVKCRVILGGSFKNTVEELRSYMSEDGCADNIGFRVVCSVS